MDNLKGFNSATDKNEGRILLPEGKAARIFYQYLEKGEHKKNTGKEKSKISDKTVPPLGSNLLINTNT